MKRLHIAMLALVAGMASTPAFAEDSYVQLYVNPDEIYAEDGLAEVNIWYDTNATNLNAMDFRIYLPSGFLIQKDEYDDYDLVVNSDVARNHFFTVGDHLDVEEPYYTFVGLSLNNRYLVTGDKKLLTFNLEVPADFDTERYPDGVTCTLGHITIAENAETVIGHHPDPFEFHIYASEIPTGIDGTVGTESDEQIYTLDGLKAERPLEPGVYVVKTLKETRKIVIR